MEQSPSVLLVERDHVSGRTTLVLNRPAKRNAFDLPLLRALQAVEAAARENGQRALILRGVDPVFCAGLDLAETADTPHEAAGAVRDLLLAVARCSLLTIAAVQSAAVAGGAGLASVCDFTVMAEDARIGFPEVRRGLVPALVTAFLRRRLRERDLRELLLTGELIPASRAQAIGLVNRVVPASQIARNGHHEAESQPGSDLLGEARAGRSGPAAAESAAPATETVLRVPQLGEGIRAARIVALLKNPGEAIAPDESLCELETDKAVYPEMLAGEAGAWPSAEAVVTLSLTFDHRVINGAGGAAFVGEIKRRIEELQVPG